MTMTRSKMHRAARQSSARGGEEGIALLLVLVVISLLVTLLGPFLIGMTQAGAASGHEASDREATMLARGVRDSALQHVAESQGAADATPTHDGLDEFPEHWQPPGLPDAQGRIDPEQDPLGRTRPVNVELHDTHARLFGPTVPQQIWANHFGWYATLAEAVEVDEVGSIPIQGGAGLPDSGYVWIGRECVRYERKGSGTLEGLSRGWSPQGQIEAKTVPDPYGPPAQHGEGTYVFDARVRLLATWAFDPGNGLRQGPRARYVPLASVDELARVQHEHFGELPPAGIEALRELLVFDAARTYGGSLGKEERVFNALETGLTTTLVVKDGTSFPDGTIVRVQVGEAFEWALVVQLAFGARGSSARLPEGGRTLVLDRPLQLSSNEEEARVRPLLPVPVNLNTATPEVLALMLEAVRPRRFAAHNVVTYQPLAPSKAREIAERIVQERSYDLELQAPASRPFANWQALHERVLLPMRDEGELETADLFHLYALLQNGLEQRLTQAGVPAAFESSGLVEYRAAAAVLSGIGSTLARRELQGLALPQPRRGAERFQVTQEQFDEVTRLDRGRPFWSTWPIATNVRPDRQYQEPPDMATAHLMNFVHGKAPRFPSQKAEESAATLGTNRLPELNLLCTGNGFAEADHPEGLDLREQKVPPLPVSVGASGPAEIFKTIATAVRDGQAGIYPMAIASDTSGGNSGQGITFGLSAWWKPRTLTESVLFDLNGGNPFRSRVWLVLDATGLTLKLYDTAGQDPAPTISSPQETAVRWHVEPGEAAIANDLWFHTAIEVARGAPGGVALFVDGALLGRPAFLSPTQTMLGELELEPRITQSFSGLVDAASIPVALEDASSFPDQGVVRIGNELHEFPSRQGNTLNSRRNDSIGGRMARGTFIVTTPGGGSGGGSASEALKISAPQHNSGVSAQLYGYSSPIVDKCFVVPGSMMLRGALGRWAPAKVIEGPDDVVLSEGNRSIRLGKGLDEDTRTAKLVIGPADGEKGTATGFDENGGYAVLVQRHWLWQGPSTTGNEVRIEEEVGGVELVRYAAGFDGTNLTITRGNMNLGQLPIRQGRSGGNAGGGNTSGNDAEYLRSRHFVMEWNKGIFSNNADPNEEETMWCYIVPVSLAIGGGMTLPDPVALGYSEFLQIRETGNENACEWVRYDKLANNGSYALRIHPDALDALQFVLTTQSGQVQKPPSARGPYDTDTGSRGLVEPPRSGIPQIGEPDSKETALDYTCRLALRFRGDPFTGTATHDHSSAMVTPVFRTVFSRRLELGRPGRGDRVALLTGASSANDTVEWHTVNWSARVSDIYPVSMPLGGSFASRANDPAGPDSNLVALRDAAGFLFQGAELREDTRQLDRLVKFPSGELPTRLGQTASLGESNVDGLPFDGLVDNLQGYFGMSANAASSGNVDDIFGRLVEQVDAGATTWRVVFPQNRFSINGAGDDGLLLVDGEIVGFRSADRQNGELTIATNGRGLLGTKARPHDAGTLLYFVSSRPATHLASEVQANDDTILVANGRSLPQFEGTALIGPELLHYAWARSEGGGETLLHMPKGTNYGDDGQPVQGSVGLFRGRYGTTPGPHGEGEMVISWPFRYWDRYATRADDPELAYFGYTVEQPDLFVTQLLWEEELPDATLDLRLLVRADERVPWSADPATTPWLWRFDDPVPQSGGDVHRLLQQASKWEFRFHVLYKSGAFDPNLFLATGWKRTPRLRSFAWSYQAPTRILREETTTR